MLNISGKTGVNVVKIYSVIITKQYKPSFDHSPPLLTQMIFNLGMEK